MNPVVVKNSDIKIAFGICRNYGHGMRSAAPISTALGKFDRKKFDALINLRGGVLAIIRKNLAEAGYTEVTTSSLVNIAGSCENPYASFRLNYYGRDAHLSQSAQLQLETLVIRLRRGVFTVNNSFREEHYDDPDSRERRLSEFTLIEAERPYRKSSPERALEQLINDEEWIVRSVVKEVLRHHSADVRALGGSLSYLKSVVAQPFKKISYERALAILNAHGGSHRFGDDLGIAEERKLLEHFDSMPVFVTHFPAKIKFFNMKRTADGKRTYSVDLVAPRLGETAGGAIREESGARIKRYLLDSKIATFIRERGGDPLEPFNEYFKLFSQEGPVVRGGFGIGFERFVAFLIGSTDILNTLASNATRP